MSPPSPSAKKIPTIQPTAGRSQGPSASDAAVAGQGPLPWPASVPPLVIALDIVRGRCPPPPELQASTEALRRSLTFVESAALHAPEPSEDIDVLCLSAATRWRVVSALALRPVGEFASDAAAFEELLHEVDGTLASLGKVKDHADPDLQEACDGARASLAKDVQKLLPSVGGSAMAVEAKADLKQLRNALAAAAKSEGQVARRGGARDIKKAIVVAALSLVALASVGFAVSRVWVFEQPQPVPALPQPPPNMEVLGNPESGTVILRSKDGKPLEGEAFEKFQAAAIAAGARVQALGPTQALVTSAR